MGNVPVQIANQCCEKAPVYNVKPRDWSSPFHSNGQLSDIFRRSSQAPTDGNMTVVVLVGGTGVGKSNLGNYLLGRNLFESRNSQESVTAVTSWIDGTWFGGNHPMRVVDCTGIGDTKGARADQKQWDTTIEVLKDAGAVSALVMVMRAGRFTKFDKEVISTLRESFGPTFWKNLCVFCTGASAKPGQLNLGLEGPKIRKKFTQIEQEQGGDEQAFQAIGRMHVYAADLDPMLCSPERRHIEFKFKPALLGLGLEELLSLDLRIPHNVMAMNGEEFKRFAAADVAIERWIEGNYFTLGLSRLAAFKSDIMAMEPFTIDNMGRLADAPEEEAPPPEQVGDKLGETIGHVRHFTAPESLEQVVLAGDVVLLKGSWLETWHAGQKPLPPRQKLPSEATWDPAVLVQELQGGGHRQDRPKPLVVAISYCWITKKHPDPNSFHLGIMIPLLKAYAGFHRVNTSSIAVFIDWCCLPQVPRSPAEENLYQRSLSYMHLWYAHSTTSVWMLSRVPAGAESYGGRGWPHFEKVMSTLANPSESTTLDVGTLRPAWSTWGHVLQDCRVRPMPPQSPETFAAELARKNFTEAADRELLTKRYAEAFQAAVGTAETLPYLRLRWGDREATRIAKLLPSCESCRELDLQQNDIGRKGGLALAAALAANPAGCKDLERLSLIGNCLDDSAKEALKTAWKQAGKQADGLELGEQRPPVAPMEIITNPADGATIGTSPLSPQRGDPTSPSRSQRGDPTSPSKLLDPRSPTRRNADELAALQMAELGARQAAFEARLHVAINRISSTLSDVGEVVGSPTSPKGFLGQSSPQGYSGLDGAGSPSAWSYTPQPRQGGFLS